MRAHNRRNRRDLSSHGDDRAAASIFFTHVASRRLTVATMQRTVSRSHRIVVVFHRDDLERARPIFHARREYFVMCCQTLEQMASVATNAQPRTILIVDDDVSQAEVLSECLTRQGFRTFTAHEGHAGIEAAKRQRPDLVLLDLRLPDANGLDVCAAIDDGPETGGTPIIILSGMEGPDIIRRSRAAGGRYYVRKPFDPNALLILIEQEIGASNREAWL